MLGLTGVSSNCFLRHQVCNLINIPLCSDSLNQVTKSESARVEIKLPDEPNKFDILKSKSLVVIELFRMKRNSTAKPELS